MAFDSKPRQETVSAFTNLTSETLLRRLEPRIMFDAAALDTAMDALDADPGHVQAADATPADFSMDLAPAAALHGSDLVGLVDHLDGPVAVQSPPDARTIVFVDANVPDLAVLEMAIANTAEIVVLDPAKDGLDQMAAYLANRHDLDAIHIISHGEPGKLHLGSSTYDAATLKAFDAELGQIGAALHQGGDILIYGCDVAKGAEGDAFVHRFADLTHADVAASTDDTGAAARRGNWDLETHTGAIDAVLINAPEWNGILAPLVISTHSQPTLVPGSGALPAGAVWTDAGTVGATHIDLRATVISWTPDPNAPVSTYTFDTAAVGASDDPRVKVQGGELRIEWSIFETGTSTKATGDVNFFVADIDAFHGGDFDGVGPSPFLPYSPVAPIEFVSADKAGLYSFATETATHLTTGYVATSATNGVIEAKNLVQSQNAEPESGIKFSWRSVDSWQIVYKAPSPPPGGYVVDVPLAWQPYWGTDKLVINDNGLRFFVHDGDGDLSFATAKNTGIPQIDLDANNSSLKSGQDYQATYTENGAGTPIGDADILLEHLTSTTLAGATIHLTNAQAGDLLAAGLMPGSIVASPYDPATGIITLSGSGTLAEYQTAIHAITFANSGENPSSADRTIDVYVTDGKFPSDVATATIHVTPVNDAPLASNDSGSAAVGAAIVIDALANDSDPDNALDPATVHIIGTASNGASLTVAGEGVWSVNAANGKITFTPASGFIGAPTAISYTVADVSGAISNAATVTVMPILSSPHVDLSGPSAYTGAFLYGHGTAPYASGAFNPTTISSVGNEVAGAGVGLSYDGSSVDVSGVTSTSLTQAVAQNDYISMSFTTQAGIPETWIQNTVNRITYGTFEFAVAISTDGFKSATLLSQNNPGSNYSGPFYDAPGSSYPWSAATDFKLAPGATYEVRVYLYNAAAGTARWDDFYVFYSNDPTGHVTTFNAGGAAVSIAAAAVEIEDANHTNMVSGSIALANKQTSDHFSIGGVLTGNGSAGTINGIHYAVTESTGTISVALSGAATKAQYAAFINSVTFQNTSSTPAVVDRTINVTVSDGVETSNVATTIVHVNVAPDIAVSLGDKSGLDGNSVSIVTKGAFSDANGDALTFSAAGLPAWLTIDPATGKITGTLPADASIGGIAGDGVYALDVTATDPQGLSVTDTFNFSAHNVAPVASNNAASTFEDDPVTFDVRGNDHDGGLDSDALEVSAIDGHAIIAGGAAISVSHGSVLLGLDGKLTFTPDANFNGSASFGYTVSDGQGGTAKAVVTVTVALVNDAPAGADSTVNTPEDVAYVLSASDFGLTDPLDSPTNTFAAVMIASLPGSGALTLNGLAVAPGQTVTLADISAGKLLWTPAANTNGAGLASLTFQVQDNGGTLNGGLDTDASPNTLTLDVTPVNDPPAIVSDDNDLLANDPSAATGSVVANDSDIDVANVIQVYDIANSSGQPVVVTAAGTVIAGDYGTLTIHQDGTYSYVLDTASAAVKALKAGDPLTDVFSYTGIDVIVAGGVTTPQGGSGTTSLTITITGVNDAPHVALGGTQSPLVNGSFEIDADGDGTPDGWAVANHIHGTEPGIDWVMPGAAPDGSYYAWLNDQPYGTASSNFYQDVPTVPGQICTLSYLQNSEHIGIPNTSAISVYADGVLVGTTTFSTIGAQPWESHTFTFTATDANTRIEFRDATNYGANGWVSGSPVLDKVSLLPGYEPPYENTFTENGSPVSIADIASDVTDVDDTHIASAVIVLTNAKPGDLMSIAGALPGGILANIDASVPGMVTITLTGSATKADYNLAIEAIHFENTSDNPDTADRLIDVTVNDGALNSNTAVATIHVVPVNDPPVLTLDPDNSQGGADNGGVDAGHPVGSPPVLISDADVFISDLDSTAIASLTIVVVGVADGAAEHIHVGGASGVDIVLDGVTAHSGTVTVGGTTFVVTYDPATGAITVTNNASGTISIADTQSLIAATTYQDTSATATEGPRTIELTVNDGAASSSAVSAIIDVHGGVIGAEDTAIPLGVNPADFGAVIDTYVTVAGVPAGALLSSGTLNSDGTWTVEIADLGSLTLTPPLNYNGAFSVEVCGAVDATSTSTTNTTMAMSFAAASSTSTTTSAATAEVCRTFDITVTPVNDAPVDTVPTPQTVDEDGTLIFSAANGNAIIIADPDADAGTGLVTVDIWADHGLLQLSQTTGLDFTVLESQIYSDQVGGAGPQAVIHMTGTLADINAALEGLKYAPDANYHGPTDLHIRTSDNGNTGSGGAQTVIGTVAITVTPTVDAVDDSVTTPEDTAVIVTPMDNDSFGGDGAITAVGAASHGTTAINVDGTITYTPNANYNGMDSFTYTVTANTGGWTYQAWSNATTVGVDPFQSADQVFANFPTTTPDSAGNTMTLSPDGVHVEAGLTAQLDVAYQNQWLQFDSNLLVGQAGTYTFSMPPAPYGHFAVDDGVQVFIDGAVVYQVSDVYGTDPVANGAVTLAAGQHTIEVRYFNWYGQSDLALTIAGPDTGNAAIDLATDPNIGVTVVTETATVNVTITPVNDAPIAANDTGTASEDGPATGGNVISGPGTDTDIDGGPLYVSSVNGDVSLIGQPVAGSTGGSFVLKADGTWTFDPGHAFDNLPAGQTRDTVITYRVADGMGGHATATVTVTVTGVNDAPVTLGPIAAVDAVDAAPVTPIDASVAFDNPGHLPLVYSASNLPAGLSIDPVTGLITGAPAHDASVQGPYVVMVTATGPSGETSTTALQINVANPAPVAVADNAATPADTPLTIAPLANDTDADHDALSITAIGVPANGTATLNPDGTINYVPNAGFVGAETISYTITDSQGGTSTATITIVVGAAPADAPVMTGPAPDQMGTDGSPITPVNVSTFFADPNGQPLAFTATGLPMGLVIDPVTGIISGTPAADASVSGPYSVVVTAVDPDGNQISTTVLFAIANPAPVAMIDYSATPLDTPVTISVLANDNDPDGDVLTVISVTPPTNGAAVLNPDGTVTYTPNAGYTGPDAFTYTVSDGQGGMSVATANVFVEFWAIQPVVDSSVPTAASGVDGAPISPIDIGSHVVDQFGTPLTFAATGLPAGLVIDPTTGVITGTLNANASTDGPFTVTVIVVDGHGVQVTIPLVITATNPGPAAAADVATTAINQPVVIGVLANDTDPDHDALTVTSTSTPAHGIVVINANGSITFTPDAGFIGTDTFTYTVTDANGATTTATVTVNIGIPGLLSAVPAIAPVTGSDGAPITPVLVAAVFGDPDQVGPLTLGVDTAALPPGITFDPATGTFSGTPANNASQGHTPGQPIGTYVVPVTGTDSGGASTTTYVTFTFANLPPVAANDMPTVSEDGPVLNGNALGNDHDTAPDSDPLTVVGAVQGLNTITIGTPFTTTGGGVLTLSANGSYTFNPGTAYNGLDADDTATETITYTIADGNGATATAQLIITINGANDAPVVIDPANPGTPANPLPATDPLNIIPDVTTADGTALTPIQVGTFVVDPEGKPMVFTLDPGVPAWLTIDPVSGEITGTPPADASQGSNTGNPGEYLVTITATDSHGTPVTTTVTLTIVNLPPVAANDTPMVSEDGPVATGNVLGNDHDTAPDSDPLTVVGAVQGLNTLTLDTPFTTAGGGVLTLHGDGSYTFNPGTAYNSLDADDTATETITYTITDGNGATTTAKLIITINGANDVPLVVNPATGQPIAAGQPVIPPQHGTDAQPIQPISAAGFFKDPDAGDVLTYSVVNLPKGLHFNPATGLISGVLDTHASVGGPFTVEVTATDNHGGHSTATFVWVIDNPLPVAVGEVARTTNGVALNSTVAGNDVDPDHDGISYRVETGPSHGVLTLNPDGTYTYLADSQFSGGDSFTYAVVDADGGVAYAVCRITVDPAINIAQHSGGGAGHNGGHTDHRIELPFRLGTDDVREYVHLVASADGSEMLSDGVSEHIRLVVEGRTHQLDQQYGAGRRGVPLHWNLGLGRDGGQDSGTIYEPLGDTPFWHGLNPLDFSGLAVREADVGNADAPVLASADADHAVPFGDRLAYIRGRFDREALQLMTDVEDAA